MIMNTKQFYLCSLVGFFLMWGSLGVLAYDNRSEIILQATLTPVATQVAAIPVTGEPEPVWTEILGFYGLIGFTALFLILAMLNLANKSTAQQVDRKTSFSEKPHKQ
jgi:hypothetical protein